MTARTLSRSRSSSRSMYPTEVAEMMCPCKDCKRREVGCHGKCEDYKCWKAEVDEQSKRREAAKQVNRMMSNKAMRRIWKKIKET